MKHPSIFRVGLIVTTLFVATTVSTYQGSGSDDTEYGSADPNNGDGDVEVYSSGNGEEGSATPMIATPKTETFVDSDFEFDNNETIHYEATTTEKCGEGDSGCGSKDAPPAFDNRKDDNDEHNICKVAAEEIRQASMRLHEIKDGLKGEKGDKGERGEVGPPGTVVNLIPGARGQKGEKGDSGSIGPQGLPGLQGPPGIDGNNGQKGEMGTDGPPGFMGTQGRKGQKGDSFVGSRFGERGPPGPPGPAGRPGFMGVMHVGSINQLMNRTDTSRNGTIAYVRSTRRFYGRVPDGWVVFATFSPNHLLKPAAKNKRRSQQRGHSHLMPDEYSSDQPWKANDQGPKPLRMIALNQPMSGNMGSIKGANYQCLKDAMDNGISGYFRAFLYSNKIGMTSIVKDPETRIVNLHNRTIFEKWEDVFDITKDMIQITALLGDKNASLLYSFDGRDVINDPTWEHNVIWHGASVHGNKPAKTCKGWKTNSTLSNGTASDFLYKKYLLHQGDHRCDEKLIVLCIEVPEKFLSICLKALRTEAKNSKEPNEATFKEDFTQCLEEYNQPYHNL